MYLGFWKKGNQNGLGKYFSKKTPRFGLWADGERLMWYNNEAIALAQLDSVNIQYKKYFNLSYDEIMKLVAEEEELNK